jgi:hypothetical protein
MIAQIPSYLASEFVELIFQLFFFDT